MVFSNLSKMLGVVSIKETDTEIQIKGIPATVIHKTIPKLWSTSTINKWMFTEVKKTSLTFPKFFAVEVVYILQQLIEEGNLGYFDKTSLEKMIFKIETETWLANTTHSHGDILDWSVLKKFSKKPFDYQMEYFQQFNDILPKYNLNGYMLASPAGSGKTWTTLVLGFMLKSDYFIGIVPKNSLEKVWEETYKQDFNITPYVSKTKALPPDIKKTNHFVFHYEAISQIPALIKAIKKKDPRAHLFFYVDESHNFNELTSQRTKQIMEIAEELPPKSYVSQWASGTPIKAVGTEAIPLLKTVDPLFTDDVQVRFKKIFGKSTSRGLDILKRRLGIVTYTIPKEEVRQTSKPIVHHSQVKVPNSERYTLPQIKKEMVEFVEQRINFYMDNMKDYQLFYDEIIKEHKSMLTTKEEKDEFAKYQAYFKEIKENYDPVEMKEMVKFVNTYEEKEIIPNILGSRERREKFRKVRGVVKYVRLVVMGEALGGVLGKRRTECYQDMAKYADIEPIMHESEKKTVIFTSFVPVVKTLETRLADYKTLSVHQETNNKLAQIVSDFGRKPEINPLLATYQSLSTAVPLTMANTVILINLPYRDYEYIQATSRIDRVGQDKQPHVFILQLDTGDVPNISTRNEDIMEWSRAQVEAMLGDSVEKKDVDEIVRNFQQGQSLANVRKIYEKVERNLNLDILKRINPFS